MNHRDVADSYLALSKVFDLLNQQDRAIDMASKSHSICFNLYGEESEITLDIQDQLNKLKNQA